MKIIRNCTIEEKNKKGIYKITNSLNNKIYIGSTNTSFNLRWNQHSCSLFGNWHHNQYLQNAFNKYKCEWTFEILEIVNSIINLRKREGYWIKSIQDSGIKLFNICNVDENALFIHSEKTRKLISLHRKGINIGILPSNLKDLHNKHKRPIIEKENGIFIREYESTKEAGEILHISYKAINNILTGISKSSRIYPNKTWEYKDNKPTKKFSRKISLYKRKKLPIMKMDLLGKDIKRYESADEIGKELKVDPANIQNMCRHSNQVNRKLKYKFRYV